MAVRPSLHALGLVGLGVVLCLVALALTGNLAPADSAPASSTEPPRATAAAPEIVTSTTVVELRRAVDADGAVDASATITTPPPTTSAAAAGEDDGGAAADAAAASPPPTISEAGANAFMATFDTPEEFYDGFDYGFSGFDPANNRNPDRLVAWTGDHDRSCGAPTTMRTIDIDRDASEALGGTIDDFDEMFWWCREHMMTAVNAVGYNIAWFSPKPYFSNISRVCWDINVTQSSTRKWTQVLFVSETDATAHPSRRGSGGFDLGYTNPIFRGAPGTPSAEILPIAGDLAGLQILNNGDFRWFENQDDWTTEANASSAIRGVTDKASRYTHCVEQISPGTIRFTQERPASHGGFQQVDVPGTIPQGPVRVVFQDDNYNAPKGEQYDPDVLTWHWDNIVVE